MANTGATTYDAFKIEVDDHALELSTEGPLGIYQNPHTSKDNVAVRGTVGPKSNQTEVNVFDTVRDANNAVGIPVKYDATTGVGASPASCSTRTPVPTRTRTRRVRPPTRCR